VTEYAYSYVADKANELIDGLHDGELRETARNQPTTADAWKGHPASTVVRSVLDDPTSKRVLLPVLKEVSQCVTIPNVSRGRFRFLFY
jgi:hypothetical protein